MGPEREKPAAGTLAGIRRGRAGSLAGVAAAVLGVSEASPYVPGQPSHAAGAPAAIRAASQLFAAQLAQYDFDLEATLVRTDADRALLADLGDVKTDAADPEGNRAAITQAVVQVLDEGVVPLVLGGDDSVPIPVFRAFAGRGRYTVVQVDAHVDWGDTIRGNPVGFGSTMRRVSEVAGVERMVQLGMRGLGSGTADQLEAARRWGSRIVTAAEWRRGGVEAALALVPEGGDVLLSIDCDGLDPSVLPAVNTPTPGGPDMVAMTSLLQGLARRARIRGCALVELVPGRDRDGMSALVAARMALTVLGLVAVGARDQPVLSRRNDRSMVGAKLAGAGLPAGGLADDGDHRAGAAPR